MKDWSVVYPSQISLSASRVGLASIDSIVSSATRAESYRSGIAWMSNFPCPEYSWIHSRFLMTAEHKAGCLDARSPSYDDGGDSANLNVKNMWDFEGFWKPYIDDLARYRYNVLSLWTRHPFPHMVDLSEKYPNDPKTLTPLEVADRLDGYAQAVDDVIGDLKSGNVTTEFRELLWDLQSMAQLGCYYADKTRCAAKYWVARESKFSTEYENEYNEAVQHIEDAEKHWIDYAKILDLHYQPQVLARTHNLDWNRTLYTKPFGGMQIQNVKDETKAIKNKSI